LETHYKHAVKYKGPEARNPYHRAIRDAICLEAVQEEYSIMDDRWCLEFFYLNMDRITENLRSKKPDMTEESMQELQERLDPLPLEQIGDGNPEYENYVYVSGCSLSSACKAADANIFLWHR
jgi:hypothetical protein